MKSHVTLAIIISIVLLTCPARAEIVELRNGQRVEGALKRATSDSVIIEVGQQTVTFKAAEVRAIYYGSAPQALTRKGDQDATAADALRSLKALRSVVELGVTYTDYGSRLADTKIKADEYLARAPGNATTDAIRSALANYEFAYNIWAHIVRTHNDVRFGTIAPLANFPACREMRELVADLKTRQYETDTFLSDDIQARLAPTLWRCASRNIAEAERATRR